MKIAIIGAGAAGCFAAANIDAATGNTVTIYEKGMRPLQKVKVSGGGRCNVTHQLTDVANMSLNYPRGRQLLKRILYRFGPEDTEAWFAARGLQLKVEDDGRMFPITDDSQSVIDCIWKEMMNLGVEVRYGKNLLTASKNESGFTLNFADGQAEAADVVVVATGGLGDIRHYSWLSDLGHTIETPVPSLFTFNLPKNPITALMGISVPVATVKVPGTKMSAEGPLLITHWGLSGPAVLKCSAIGARHFAEKNYRFTISVNWLGDETREAITGLFSDLRQTSGGKTVAGKNPVGLPKRLWDFFLQRAGIGEAINWGGLTSKQTQALVSSLVADEYAVAGKTTFKEEFVTCGGVALQEIEVNTLQSKIVAGLYFAGEVMDVDGVTGGYNFQHAWSSARIVAESINKPMMA